ncbi:28S ribosomal protein S9, mitochondrial [Harmonia axyridis]|uniref:28S ribosomal protein S9, mitochondrial n=1 Tax=Harmonia axyridis TaxID=115357 RepID=UPI001E27917C|nr:28S ribosomal protein S9, mitochondrial [Harmonia axyridis]
MILKRIFSPRAVDNIGRLLSRNAPLTQAKIASQFSTENVDLDDPTISKAMKAYLTRANEHEKFMKKEIQEYQIGKRHLANMMGEDPETFTQEDVDNAITYLFPSGLFEKKARPMMKPPEQIFPQRKAAEFDKTGRPFHFLFYTSRPNFYHMLYEIVEHIEQLNKFEDIMLKKGLQPDPNAVLDKSGSQWIDKTALESLLLETLSDRDYEQFLNAIEALCKLPYASNVKDFIFKYLRPLMNTSKTIEAPKPNYDQDGRAYVTVYECARKHARGTVTIRSPGTGKISINNKDITYFEDTQSREQVLFPLLFSNMIGKVDIEAEVGGGGFSGQAGAVRWGIAWGLRSFLDEKIVEKMRLAGLLTKDVRTRERQKPGQQGARRKFTWKKR